MAALTSSGAMMQQEQEAEGGLEVLEADLAEMENSVYHLVRSNVEIAQFLDTAPRDEDLEQALEENKLVVAKKQRRVKALRNKIADLKMYHPHLNNTATRTTPQARTPPGGFHTATGGGAVASGFGGVGGSGGGSFGGVPGRDGGGGVGSQGVAGPGAAADVVSAGGVQDITTAMAAGSMGLGSMSSGTTALPADVGGKVVGSGGGSGGQRVDNNAAALHGGVAREVVEGNSSSNSIRESGGGGGGGGSVADGSGGVML